MASVLEIDDANNMNNVGEKNKFTFIVNTLNTWLRYCVAHHYFDGHYKVAT